MAPPTLADTIADLAELFEDNDLTEVVLAGHSQGGFIARAASQHLASRIATLAYLDAPVPRNGEASRDLNPGGPFPPMDLPDWIAPPPSNLPAEFAALLTPVAPILSIEPVVLTDPAALALPERFVFFERTPGSYPCAHTRSRLEQEGRPYEVLAADHDAPLNDPELVADWIERVARQG